MTRLPLPRRLATATSTLPCVVCFSSADPLVRDGVNAGIFVLLGVTTLVLAGFGWFAVRLARRARDGDTPGVVVTTAQDFATGFADRRNR